MLIALGIVAALVTLAAGLVWYCIIFPRQPYRGRPPALTGEERELAQRLRRHVTAIASTPHNVTYYKNLEAAACYIEQTLSSFGLKPLVQVFAADGRPVRNIEVVLDAEEAGGAGTYVIGAHYDSVYDCPGANDNGTGVAAVLELARLLADGRAGSARIRLAFFVNEEQPYSKTPAMGSWRYAKRLSEEGEKVLGAIVLETIGYFSDAPGTQAFPLPIGLFYPNIGNFVAFVGMMRARGLVRRTLRTFRRSAAFPSIGGVAPAFIPGIDLSDHWAFHHFGCPALMITDTAPYRNPQYHRLTDKPETVDYESLARVTMGLERTVRELAGHPSQPPPRTAASTHALAVRKSSA